MKITNKQNLPSAFFNICNEEYEIKPKRYSVTNLLLPLRELMILRKNFNEIEQDVSSMIWLVFGRAVHYILEQNDKTGYAEMKLTQEIRDGYVLSGRIDLYNEAEHSVEDYKTTSVWKVIHEEFDDWKKQGLMYAWLLRKNGYLVERMKFHALLKDWSPTEKRRTGAGYPESAVFTWIYEINELDMIDIERFIRDKFDLIIEFEPKDEYPMCSQEERWYSGDKFAVIKEGNKTAFRVFDTEKEAQDMATFKGKGFGVVQRLGEDKKCRDYCIARTFCPYYKGRFESVLKEEDV